MYLKLKIPLKIFLFTISRFLLQFSSLLFLFFLIFFSETLFNSTQFLTNFSNLLSYPAIAISTLIVTMPIFFKSFFEFYNSIIEKIILLSFFLTTLFLSVHVFEIITFYNKTIFQFIWILVSAINVYLLHFCLSISIINKKFVIPIISLFIASITRIGTPLLPVNIISDELIMDTPIFSIFLLPLILFISLKNKQKKIKSITQDFSNFKDKKVKKFYFKSIILFLFTVWQYIDYFVIPEVINKVFDLNYGFMFLLGKVGFSVTVTLLYSLFVLFNYQYFKKFEKFQFIIALTLIILTYISLYLIVSIFDNMNIFSFSIFKNAFNYKCWYSILIINIIQSFVYYFFIKDSFSIKKCASLFIFTIFYFVILCIVPIHYFLFTFIACHIILLMAFTSLFKYLRYNVST